uniref:Syntaxin binding protein 6 n=1 Tax=Equus asinus TaxID=9793 RepID=A0A9L0ISC5_EQUAS
MPMESLIYGGKESKRENSLRALLACSTMSAKSAISKEIFAPLDERMLGAVQVKRRTKKKIPFLATGGQGEYLTYICLSDEGTNVHQRGCDNLESPFWK